MALLQIHSDIVAVTKLIPLPLIKSFLIGEYSSFGMFWIIIPGHLSGWHREWKIVYIQEFLSLSISNRTLFSSAPSFYRQDLGPRNSEDTASAIQCLPTANFLYSKANHSLIVEHLRGIVEYLRGTVEHLRGNKM